MRTAMERLEAQGPSHGPVRPRKTHRLADRKAGLREPRKLPGASRRSIPLVEGNKENRETGPPRGPKSKPRDSEALAEERWLRWLKQYQLPSSRLISSRNAGAMSGRAIA